jgi:hypothetical protein
MNNTDEMFGDLVDVAVELETNATMKKAIDAFPVELHSCIMPLLIHAYTLGMSKTITVLKASQKVIQ